MINVHYLRREFSHSSLDKEENKCYHLVFEDFTSLELNDLIPRRALLFCTRNKRQAILKFPRNNTTKSTHPVLMRVPVLFLRRRLLRRRSTIN